MKRIITVLAVAALMAVMLAAMAAPAFAQAGPQQQQPIVAKLKLLPQKTHNNKHPNTTNNTNNNNTNNNNPPNTPNNTSSLGSVRTDLCPVGEQPILEEGSSVGYICVRI